ncbi:MAG TPA: phytoene/squalene synthase family protein [Gemmatimonadaceae bacterium]|nr:phytoene/squalene synthase family protein [Gemmatimonadaceae bacterium]
MALLSEEPQFAPWRPAISQDTSSHDAAYCAAVVTRHARTFALASALLPSEKRRGAFAVYAFCRRADDLVDAADPEDPTSSGERLRAYRESVTSALGNAATSGAALFPGSPPSPDPVLRELAWAVRRFDIPTAALEELLDGVARDLVPTTYATWDALTSYAEGVASSVGEMCAAVFGVPRREHARTRAIGHARTLGVAMQLTNILRDVGEDARRGRCYLPEEDLAGFGFTVVDVLERRLHPRWPQWRALMRFEIARARALYQAALPGIDLLHPDAQRCVLACASGYAGILSALERLDFDCLSRRAVVPRVALLRVVARAWLRRPARLAGRGGSTAPFGWLASEAWRGR